MPLQDAAVSLIHNQLSTNVIHEIFILVRIREEDLERLVHFYLVRHRRYATDRQVQPRRPHDRIGDCRLQIVYGSLADSTRLVKRRSHKVIEQPL
jgi:hypothetical protein